MSCHLNVLDFICNFGTCLFCSLVNSLHANEFVAVCGQRSKIKSYVSIQMYDMYFYQLLSLFVLNCVHALRASFNHCLRRIWVLRQQTWRAGGAQILDVYQVDLFYGLNIEKQLWYIWGKFVI